MTADSTFTSADTLQGFKILFLKIYFGIFHWIFVEAVERLRIQNFHLQI